MLSKLKVLHSQDKIFFFYIIASYISLLLLIILQYYRHNLFGTRLLLGWDSPGYVWLAKYVLKYGPLHMIHFWGFPQLYTQIHAFLGYLFSDVVLIERVLPLVFVPILIYTSSRIVLEVTGNIHVAGLNAFLTVASLNVLRLLSDLHRNLMAMSLSFLILVLTNFGSGKSVLRKQDLPFLFLFLLVASTHLETYLILGTTLLLHSFLVKDFRKAAKRTLVLAIPAGILFPMLWSSGFFVRWGSELPVGGSLPIKEIFLWLGGSAVSLVFLIFGGLYLLRKAVREKNELSQVILCWITVVMFLFLIIESGLFNFSSEISFRLLLMMPVPILLSLSVPAILNGLKNLKITFLPLKRNYSFDQAAKILASIFLIFLIIHTSFVVFWNIDYYLTPYLPNSTHQKIVKAKEFVITNQLEVPVALFYSELAIWQGWLIRTYIGAELGEHFAYYGEFDNLLRLVPTEPTSEDPAMFNTEMLISEAWFNELQGTTRTLWYHSSFINSFEKLRSSSILIISPDLYDAEIPYHLRSFHIGDGVYIIPPNSLIENRDAMYGPAVTVLRDGVSSQLSSEYLSIDPNDPSTFYIRVNASSGYKSYNITGFPSSWVFVKIEQGGDVSYPEQDPMRLDGALAVEGNDPADKFEFWRKASMNDIITLDASFKKEGTTSLKNTGIVDPTWGTLGAIYDFPGTWDMQEYSSMAVWASSNETLGFCVNLIDSNGEVRVFSDVRASEEQSTTAWKRFVINFDDYTSETPGFTLDKVDFIFFYLHSNEKKGEVISFWIDDLTVDTALSLNTGIYKARVPANETVMVYFKTTFL